MNQKIDVQIPSVKHEDVPADDNKDDNGADSDNGTDTDKNDLVVQRKMKLIKITQIQVRTKTIEFGELNAKRYKYQ